MNKTQELAMKKLADVMEYDIDLDNWDVTNLMLCASAQISRLKEQNHNMEILLGDKWHPVPKGGQTMTDSEKIAEAIGLGLRFGDEDGGHHKMWVIDQMIRILSGDNYDNLIKEYSNGEDGENTYEWDCGIAP